MGPAINLSDYKTQFKLIQSFGWHFLGGPTGPAIGIELQESFGGDLISIEILPKFTWDIAIIKGLGLYLSPSAGIGFVHVAAQCPSGFNCAGIDLPDWNGLTIQFAFDAKLALADRGIVFFRPFSLGIYAVDTNTIAGWEDLWRWDMLVAGGVIF